MFETILNDLFKQKQEYLTLKKELYSTPLENSINQIIEQIDGDIDKILSLLQI